MLFKINPIFVPMFLLNLVGSPGVGYFHVVIFLP